MKLLHGLVVDSYGHLCVGIEGKLYVVAGPVLARRLVSWQLQVLAAPTSGRGVWWRKEETRTRERAFKVENRNLSSWREGI